MAVTAPGSDLWVLSTPESARADAKSVTSSSKSVTHGRPHDSDQRWGALILPSFDTHVEVYFTLCTPPTTRATPTVSVQLYGCTVQ